MKIKSLNKYLPFLIGFSLCNNIFYIFNHNHMYINFSNFISCFALFYLAIFNKTKLKKGLNGINRIFILFILVTVFSIIPAVFYFFNNFHLMSSYFNGIPSLIMLFIEYLIILSYSEEKHEMLNGIKWGFILNLLYSFIQYLFYIKGSVLTLFFQFPNDSFQVCGSYSLLNGNSAFNHAFKIYLYRAQGFFLETSHYLTYVTGSALLSISLIKNKKISIVFLLLLLYLGLLSISGNYIMLILTILLYYGIIFLKNKSKKIKRKTLLIIPILLFSSFVAVMYAMNNEQMQYRINYTLSSLNFGYSDNENRSRSIIEGLQLIEKYPFGIGYNNTSNVLKNEFPSEIQSYIFSTLVLNELELGLLGNIIYLIFVFKFPIFIIRKSNKKEDILVAVSMLGVSLCQLTNGISFWNIQYILGIYAIGNIYYNTLKKNEIINE